jgi:hypothetical protein
MQDDVRQGAAVMALFDGGDNIASEVELLTDGMHLAFKAQGDSIYTKP